MERERWYRLDEVIGNQVGCCELVLGVIIVPMQNPFGQNPAL